jgi:hypothetical protein
MVLAEVGLNPARLFYSKAANRSTWLAVGLFLLSVVALCALGANRYLWDFRLYYQAGLAANRGIDPYNAEALAEIIPMARVFPVSYPWFALLPYRFLALFSWPDAILLFTAFKLAALGGLLFAWRRLFPNALRHALFPVFLVAAFNASLLLDLRSGNAALFETALLASSFIAYAARRHALFAILVALAASLKIAPIFFLSLLLFTPERSAWRSLGLGIVLFVAILAAPLLVAPEAFHGFLRNATAVIDERGSICPSTLPVIRDLGRLVGISAPVPEILFLLTALAVTALAAWTAQKLRHDPRRLVVIAVFTYALIHPRFKDYAAVLLVAPAFHLLLSRWRGAMRYGFMLLALLPMRPVVFTGVATWRDWSHEYYPWFLVLFFWMTSILRAEEDSSR